MKVRITYREFSERVAVVEAEDVQDALRRWNARDEELIDFVCDVNVEIDGGIDWDSAEFTVVGRRPCRAAKDQLHAAMKARNE